MPKIIGFLAILVSEYILLSKVFKAIQFFSINGASKIAILMSMVIIFLCGVLLTAIFNQLFL